MSDYYDRLEQQLMHATARRSPRAGLRITRRRGPRDWIALASALAVAAGVAAIFVGLRPSARRVEHPPAQRPLTIVRNDPYRALPPLAGEFSCATELVPPQVDRPGGSIPYDCYVTHVSGRPSRVRGAGARGTVTINVGEPAGLGFSIDVSGLRRSPPGGDYAVWLLPADQNAAGVYGLIRGRRPKLIGIVTPPVGATGRLRAQGTVPTLLGRQATGNYLFVVTQQGHPSSASLGRIVLEGWLSF